LVCHKHNCLVFIASVEFIASARVRRCIAVRRPKIAKPFLLATFCVFWVACTPYFAEGALHLLEAQTAALDNKPHNADAIVILGGGTYFRATEYAGNDTVSDTTLARLR
jgi:uncharacterized SAM-binding protein YcdF (DUF218 family)